MIRTIKTLERQRERIREAEIMELMIRLGSRSGAERQHARQALVGLGRRAVGVLIPALSADRDVLRWEAAKAFTELRASEAAPALVRALEDEDVDVRWVAAEALIHLGSDALEPLLRALMTRSDSVELREGGHHVLHELQHGPLADIIAPVLTALENYDADLRVPISAEVALSRLRRTSA